LQSLVLADSAAHPHAPDPERPGFEVLSHEGNDLGFAQTKLQGHGFERRVILPGHANDGGHVGGAHGPIQVVWGLSGSLFCPFTNRP
jgi:hypothetical protein